MFENIRSDFRAHNRDWGARGFWVMLVYRFGRWRYGVRNVIIGANAVVLCDVPANSIAVGMPATIKPRSQTD
jgi:hypothetical protein